MKYLTEFKNKKDILYSWHIFAETWGEAQEEADERGIGEIVVGYIPAKCKNCEQIRVLDEPI